MFHRDRKRADLVDSIEGGELSFVMIGEGLIARIEPTAANEQDPESKVPVRLTKSESSLESMMDRAIVAMKIRKRSDIIDSMISSTLQERSCGLRHHRPC